MRFFTKKKLPLALALFFLIIGITLVLSVLPEKQQTTSRAAAGSAVLSLSPSSTASNPLKKNTGETISLDIMLDPGAHLVTYVKFQLQFDPGKLKPAPTNAFLENTAAFPVKVEGPTVGNNSIEASLSIGADATKAIRAPVKIGTLNFVAIAPTTGTTELAFSITEALSSAQADGAGQNVLSTTIPAYIQIGGTPISGIPSSLAPSGTSPTSGPFISGNTILQFTILLHGIGASGDNPNTEASLNNKNPLNPQRTLTVEAINSENESVFTTSMPIVYTEEGTFTGQLGTNLPAGNYFFRLKTENSLRKTLPTAQKIVANKANEIPSTSLISGDINNDNYINVIDYNAMRDCGYGKINPLPIADPNSVANSEACRAHEPVQSVDLDDNGVINNFDYNLFLRELSVQSGD